MPTPRSRTTIATRRRASRVVLSATGGPSPPSGSATAARALVSRLTSTVRTRSASVTSDAAGGIERQRHVGRRRRRQDGVAGRAADVVDVGGGQVEADRAGEVEHLVDDAVQAIDLAVDVVGGVAAVVGRAVGPQQRPQRALDDHQRIADLVRDHGGQAAERRQPLALRGVALRCRHRLGQRVERRRHHRRVLVVPRRRAAGPPCG